MYEKLARKAIAAAIANEWNKALELNLEILEDDPNDVGAINRASRAYLETGDINKAKEYANLALSVDPLNTIADKFIQKCNALNGSVHNHTNQIGGYNLSKLFLEETGKTRIVSLINLSDQHVLARLNTGDQVEMQHRPRRVAITTFDDIYVGRLPDDIAMRLIHLVNNGNSYCSHIKSVTTDNVTIFIREISRSNEMQNIVSFPQRK